MKFRLVIRFFSDCMKLTCSAPELSKSWAASWAADGGVGGLSWKTAKSRHLLWNYHF